ncbi:MAG: alpha/beta hydrolase [Candidatus Binatia bacterium]
MKRLCLRSWLAFCLTAFSLAVIKPSAAEATCPVLAPVCKITNLDLPNGDAADVYYPNVPSAYRQYFKDAFPIIVVLQGANVDKSHYEILGQNLAKFLFVVVIPNHFRAVPPFGAGFFSGSSVVSNALAQMKTEDVNPTSSLHLIVDTGTVGLVGHSFGGVAGLFSSAADGCAVAPVPPFCEGPYARPPGLKAAVFYGTSLAVPGATPPVLSGDLNTSGVATALLHGTKDGVETLAEAQLTYPTLENPRALIALAGANHYGICDENNPLGAQPDFSPPTLSQAGSLARVVWWTGWWLRTHLLNDPLGHWLICEAGGTFDPVVTVSTAGVCRQ